jgi:hypothetical protein
MTTYHETEVAGTTYVRCKQVAIYNPINKTPTVSFMEEKVVLLGEEQTLTIAIPGFLNMMYDPLQVVPIIDPETLLPTGSTVLMAEIYVMLFSAYLAAALARDDEGQVVG